MQTLDVPLTDWLPDQPSRNNPGCEEAINVRPVSGGFGPLNSLTASGDTLTSPCRGAMQLFDSTGSSLIVGGMEDRLFTRRGAITETAGMTSIGLHEHWDFAQFNNFVIATANGNSPQHLDAIDTDDTWSALPGSPPVAKRCGKVGEFLMLGAIQGNPSRIQWSSYNNPGGDWTPARGTQAGFADLPPNYGEVQQIVGGRFGLVFQQRAIHRLSYVGPPVVWRADELSVDRGAIAPFSVVNLGYLVFFLAQDGFFLTNGASVEPIGTSRVNEWFFENVNQDAIAETHGAIDWQNELIVWAFKSQSDVFDRLLIYSWPLQRWSYAEVPTGWVVSSAVDGIDLDSLDAIYGGLDSIPVSLDSDIFKARDRRLAAFVNGSASEYMTFTGVPLQSEFLTGEFEFDRRTFVDGVRPLILADTPDGLVQVSARNELGAQTFSPGKGMSWDGFCPVRWEGSRVAFRHIKPGTEWSEMTGLRVRYAPAGQR